MMLMANGNFIMPKTFTNDVNTGRGADIKRQSAMEVPFTYECVHLLHKVAHVNKHNAMEVHSAYSRIGCDDQDVQTWFFVTSW
mgnify:CR=1 FL=1